MGITSTTHSIPMAVFRDLNQVVGLPTTIFVRPDESIEGRYLWRHQWADPGFQPLAHRGLSDPRSDGCLRIGATGLPSPARWRY